MKKVILVILAIIMLFSFVSCTKSEKSLNKDVAQLEAKVSALENEISELEAERNSLKEEIIDTQAKNGTVKYVVTFKIKQTHFTLALTEHFKDALNDISISIPVDKEYYDSVEIGDEIDDSFRLGSFIFKGSFGSWDVSVKDKEIMYE